MSTQDQRIAAHNAWPAIELFQAERTFRARLAERGEVIPFETVTLAQNPDATYHVCVGHLVDALDALPHRPDQFFDHSFRVIDQGARPMFRKQGIKGIVQGLPTKLLTSSTENWSAINDTLLGGIPLMTCRYLAKRMLIAHARRDDEGNHIADRIEKCIRKSVYDEFAAKFSGTVSTGAGLHNSREVEKAASFLKIFLSGSLASRPRGSGFPLLDLSQTKNLLTQHQRMEFVLSILLFTMRNERAHGGVLSPFRTSRASLERYQSYYFAMLCAYIFSLGVLSLRWSGSVPANSIAACASANVALQSGFFSNEPPTAGTCVANA